MNRIENNNVVYKYNPLHISMLISNQKFMQEQNKYTALERLQFFKPVAAYGILKAALIEECELAGEPCPEPTIEMVVEFTELIGFKPCEEEGCDLWFNDQNEWFVQAEGKKICRMCALMKGIKPDF